MTGAGSGAVIVTGGGYGIGRASAVALAGDGWAVVVVDLDGERARETVDLVRSAGGQAECFCGDVSDPACADKAVALAKKTFGVVRGLINCAAIRHAGKITEVSYEKWRQSFSVGLDGVFNFCKAVIPELIAAGGGSIVNLSSPSAFGRKGVVAYSATKAAVNTLSACLATDHAADGIRVNVVIPGFTLTGMTESYPAEKLAFAAAQMPSGRAGAPEDVAELIRFLMSPAGESFTGGQFGNLPLPAF